MRSSSIRLAMLVAIMCASSTWADTKSAAEAVPRVETADSIMTRGHIQAPSGPAEALAIRRGIIVAVGSEAAVSAYHGANTRVIDLQGDTVLPGLHDLHVHPIFAGISAGECSIPQGSSLPATQKIVKACVEKAAPGRLDHRGSVGRLRPG